MTDTLFHTIKNDCQLNQYAAEVANEIAEEVALYGGEAYDMAQEHANGCSSVIYYHHAHTICQNCNVENGEAFLEECGGPSKDDTYDSIAVIIAGAELRARIEQKLYDMGVE